jgi:two-component system, chemotaxis family, sensor kinase CheA
MIEDLVNEFLVESTENLDRLDSDLVELEQQPYDAERLASVFRTIHTLKGTCGFLGFNTLATISHIGETLLAKIRDGELILNAQITTGLLSMVDAIRAILSAIEQTGAEGEGDYSAVIAELTCLNDAVSPVEERRVEDRRINTERRAIAATDASLRVDVALLDTLMNLVGELGLARDQILQFAATHTDNAFVTATQRLNAVTSELQQGVMKTRMQPIENIWRKYPRVVRDLATQCGKQVRIEMEGNDTDLDKTIIEAIKDPLTHVVRNSIDHGIEDPQVRVQRGKSAEGVVRLRAFHEGGQINIEISDDGAGIDTARVKDKAIQQGFITAEQAGRMAEHEIVRLVFLPGFSTAETLSHISGRGVGLDVVKTNIEKIGGQVHIQNRFGEGTTLKITFR